MRICNKGEGINIVTNFEVFIINFTPDIEDSAENISEWNKIKIWRRNGKKIKKEIEKLRPLYI